jgi:hypothetical protein
MDDRTLLALCAIHSFALAAFHLMFWRLFRWREELPRMSVANRAILQIINLRLIYVFLGVGALCLAFPEELVATRLGRAMMLGMSAFWIGRSIEQFVFLPFNRPLIHALTGIFMLGALLFAWPVLR